MNEPYPLLLVNEHDVQTDLREFGTAIVRELYLATQKLAAEESDFAAAQRIVDRPLSLLRKWFRLFTVADLSGVETELSFAGLRLGNGPFKRSLRQLLGRLDISHVTLVPPLAPPELHAFLNALARPDDRDARRLTEYLEQRGVRSIRLNDTNWPDGLAERPPLEIEGGGPVQIKSYVMNYWGQDTGLICAAAGGGLPGAEELVRFQRCFVSAQMLEAILAPRFAQLQVQDILEYIRGTLDTGGSPSEHVSARPSSRYWRSLFEAMTSHPHGYELTYAARDLLQEHKVPLDWDELVDSQVRAQYEATRAVEEATTRIFSAACTVDDLKRWGVLFARLLRSGPSDKTASLLDALILHLKRDDLDARRKAHFLLGSAMSAADATGESDAIRWITERLAADIENGEETFEFGDLLAGAGELLLAARSFATLAQVAESLRHVAAAHANPARRRVAESVLDRWRQVHWVAALFRTVTEERDGSAAEAATVLAALGGAEVAARAVNLITHAQRRVRLAMLELLGSLGPTARLVCVERVAPEALWSARQKNDLLADESWYVVRNAFHILGRVGGAEALAVFKQHAQDPDKRVRLEIVRALEKMATADARSMLLEFAEDPSVDVRRAALVALGAIGGEHEVYVLRELFAADPEAAETALYAIGHIGGRAAKEYLFGVLEDDDVLRQAGYEGRSEALREVTLKALVQNPDAEIVNRVEAYCQRHGRTFRIPVVTDELSDTARITLERARAALGKGS